MFFVYVYTCLMPAFLHWAKRTVDSTILFCLCISLLVLATPCEFPYDTACLWVHASSVHNTDDDDYYNAQIDSCAGGNYVHDYGDNDAYFRCNNIWVQLSDNVGFWFDVSTFCQSQVHGLKGFESSVWYCAPVDDATFALETQTLAHQLKIWALYGIWVLKKNERIMLQLD